MMAVPVETSPDFSPGRPVLLFERRFVKGAELFTNYDVDPVGKGFIMIEEAEYAGGLQVVLNRFQELESLAPHTR